MRHKHKMIIVEVAMEIAYGAHILREIYDRHGRDRTRSCAMSNSVGGIGPLLRERIEAQAALGPEVIGIGLLYENVWIQGFHQWGQIYIEKRAVGRDIREVLEDSGIRFNLEMYDSTSTEVKVWKTQLGKALVYLLDVPNISNVVYPGPEDAPQDCPDAGAWAEDYRLKQSWLIGRGSLALLKILDKKPDVIVQSETPTFFAHHSLVTDSFQKDPFFKSTQYVFNDHTPLEYAHPVWTDPHARKARIDPHVAGNKKYRSFNRDGIDVTRLLIGVSDATYGVSRKHRNVMENMTSLKGLGNKISYITNGIDVRFWQDVDYRNFEKMSDHELVALKDKKRQELIGWLWKEYRLWVDWRTKIKDMFLINWTRRVTAYKRFDVLEQLLRNPEYKQRFLKTKMVVLIGGRIHQNDDLSQNVMFTLLDLVTQDPDLKDRIVVLDNYNIWSAPKIFHGVDATIMLADDGREASATGFMKAQVNGAVVIASPDGAIPESVFFGENGFEVPYVDGQPQPEGLLKAFEEMDQEYRNPDVRAKMIRSAFRAERMVNIDRTARDMIKLYDSL